MIIYKKNENHQSQVNVVEHTVCGFNESTSVMSFYFKAQWVLSILIMISHRTIYDHTHIL
jgi:hypothetical protein